MNKLWECMTSPTSTQGRWNISRSSRTQRRKRLRSSRNRSGAMQSQFHSIQAVQKPWKSTRMKDVLVETQRLVPTMQKLQNTKVVNTVKTSQVQYIDEIVKDRTVAILAQAISCSNVRGIFPFTSSSGFVLSKCLQPSFVVSHIFSWHV